jgi:hypothetical protein
MIWCGKRQDSGLVRIETLAALDPDPPHLGEDRFIADVRRLKFEDPGGVGEELAGRHRVDLGLRGVFMSTPGSTLPTTGSTA